MSGHRVKTHETFCKVAHGPPSSITMMPPTPERVFSRTSVHARVSPFSLSTFVCLFRLCIVDPQHSFASLSSQQFRYPTSLPCTPVLRQIWPTSLGVDVGRTPYPSS